MTRNLGHRRYQDPRSRCGTDRGARGPNHAAMAAAIRASGITTSATPAAEDQDEETDEQSCEHAERDCPSAGS